MQTEDKPAEPQLLSDDDFAALAARSPALKRLIEEVRVEGISAVNAYNRVYSRHNR